MKRRQELGIIAGLMPAEMQPLVAVHMCDTIESDYVKSIKNDIIANLDSNIKLTTQAQDPVAIHQMKQMQGIIDQSMQQLEFVKTENDQLKQQVASLSLALQNQKERNMVDLAKHADNMEIKQAELELKAQQQGVDIQLDIADKQSELAKEAVDIEEKKISILENMI